jgi:hypothetical protein
MKDDSTTALLGYHTRGTFRSAEPRSHSISMPSRLATLVSLSCEHAFAPSVEMPNIAGWNDIAWSAIHIPTDSLHCSSEPQRACSHTTSQSRTYRVYAWHTVYRYVSKILSSTSCCACLFAFSRGNSSFICLISLDAPNPDLGSCYPRLSANATSRTGKDRKSSWTATPDSGRLYRVNAVPRRCERRCLPTRTPRSEADIHGLYSAPSTCQSCATEYKNVFPRRN